MAARFQLLGVSAGYRTLGFKALATNVLVGPFIWRLFITAEHFATIVQGTEN